MAQLPLASCCEMRLEGSCTTGILGLLALEAWDGGGQGGANVWTSWEQLLEEPWASGPPQPQVRVGPWICFQERR